MSRKTLSSRRFVLSFDAETTLSREDVHTPDPSLLLDLGAALEALSPAERLCVSLCHGAGFTHVEISDQLQIPLGTVKSHISRGTRKLRSRLADAAPDRPGGERRDEPENDEELEK